MATDNKNNKIDSIIVQKPKSVLKSYSALTLLANILISLSAVGFTAIGALNQLDVVYLVGIMSVLSLFGFVGRFIKQDISGTDTEGPMGFRGLSIRFVWFIERTIKGSWLKLKGSVLGLFAKDE